MPSAKPVLGGRNTGISGYQHPAYCWHWRPSALIWMSVDIVTEVSLLPVLICRMLCHHFSDKHELKTFQAIIERTFLGCKPSWPWHTVTSCFHAPYKFTHLATCIGSWCGMLTANQEACCVVCDLPGNISDQLFCTSCGQHYHGNCLDPAVEVNPIVRAGWQCPECKICQTCRYFKITLTV